MVHFEVAKKMFANRKEGFFAESDFSE